MWTENLLMIFYNFPNFENLQLQQQIMSDFIMRNDISLPISFKNKKYAVRLRLRKSKQCINDSEQSKQSGVVGTILSQQNSILKNNINKLSDLKHQDLNVNFRRCIQTISRFHNQQLQKNNKMVEALSKKIREGLQKICAQVVYTVKQSQNEGKPKQNQAIIQKANQNKQAIGPEAQSIQKLSQIGLQINKQILQDGTIIKDKDPRKQIEKLQEQTTTGNQTNRNADLKRKQGEEGQKLSTNAHMKGSYNTGSKNIQGSPSASDQHEWIIKMNSQLKTQNSEMQHYIINLKEQINQKDSINLNQTREYKSLQQQLKRSLQILHSKEQQCHILKEQIAGYENKLDNLEEQVQRLKKQIKYLREDNQDHDGKQDEHEQSQSETQTHELETIFHKTKQMMQKCQKLEEQQEKKQQNCQNLEQKLNEILNLVCDLCDQQNQVSDVLSISAKDLLNSIISMLDKKLSIIEEQFNERQNKLESMIAEELDQALRMIEELNSKQFKLSSQQWTIIDKIQYLKESINYFHLRLPHYANNSVQNGAQLQIKNKIYNRLQQIEQKSNSFKEQLSQNSQILYRFECQAEGQQKDRPQINPVLLKKQSNLADYILQLEGIFNENQKLLSSQNDILFKLFQIQGADSSNGKIYEYLAQLEDVLKSIYKHQHVNLHEKCIREKDCLQNQLKQMAMINENMLTKVENLLGSLSTKQSEKLKNLQKQISALAKRLKSNRSKQIEEGMHESQQKIQRARQQSIKLKNKYFQSNPQFVDMVIAKLMEIRKISSEQQLFKIADVIFDSIKNRDDKFKQEMRRKKQVMKQRAANIKQICNKVRLDSSVEDLSRSRK